MLNGIFNQCTHQWDISNIHIFGNLSPVGTSLKVPTLNPKSSFALMGMSAVVGFTSHKDPSCFTRTIFKEDPDRVAEHCNLVVGKGSIDLFCF